MIKLNTDASDYQLGSVIMQNDLPVAYYSRKLSAAQKNYAIIDKVLFSIFETPCKEFRSILLDAVIHVQIDHVILFIIPYTLNVISGVGNILKNIFLLFTMCDSISRLPRLESLVRDDIGPKFSASTSTSTFSIELDDESIFTCFLDCPILEDNIEYPLDYYLIHDRQLLDIQLILN